MLEDRSGLGGFRVPGRSNLCPYILSSFTYKRKNYNKISLNAERDTLSSILVSHGKMLILGKDPTAPTLVRFRKSSRPGPALTSLISPLVRYTLRRNI
jgi:hypothetical protein